MVFENIDESICVHVPNQPYTHNGIEMKLTMDHTIAHFDSIQGIVEMLGVGINDILDVDYDEIEKDMMVCDWLDKNYPALSKFENDFSLWYHMDIVDIFDSFKTVYGTGKDGKLDKLLIAKYNGYGYILIAPRHPNKDVLENTENNKMELELTDTQRHSLAEYMLQCTHREDIELDELNVFAKAEWNDEAIEAVDYFNDIIDWMRNCGMFDNSLDKQVKVTKLYRNAYLPAYEHQGDSGFSLRVRNTVKIHAGEQKLIKLGIACIIPDNCEVQIRSRSGRTLDQKLVVAQGTGTIDSGYRGEIGVILYNRSKKDYYIERGESIAQGVLCKLPSIEIVEILKNELTTSERGDGAYGSTGL